VAGEEKEHTLGDSTSLRWLGVNYRASDGWKARLPVSIQVWIGHREEERSPMKDLPIVIRSR
jgi:hypothetical protein